MVNAIAACGARGGSGATVTTRLISPIPVSGAAWTTIAPDGACAARGSVHVEPAAQRAVIAVAVSGRLAANRRVQPCPLPRPSATVTGTCTAPASVAVAGADL